MSKEQFRLNTADDNGVTLKDHLEQVWKQTGQKPGGLNVSPIPESLFYLFDVFLDLNAARASGFGPSAITYEAIDAYCRLHNLTLSGWEVDVIRKIDRAWFEVRQNG